MRGRGGESNGGRKKKHETDGRDRQGDRCGERRRAKNTKSIKRKPGQKAIRQR